MAEVAEKLNPEKLVASKNWRLILQKIITGFVLLFCFIIFPVFFIHSSLTIIFKNNTDVLRQEKLLEMAKTLEYLEKYSSNKKYFHYLMTNISEAMLKIIRRKRSAFFIGKLFCLCILLNINVLSIEVKISRFKFAYFDFAN